jgi:hypothetical protein
MGKLMKSTRLLAIVAAFGLLAAGFPSSLRGAVFSVTVDGPDVIFLAGRTDVVIPAANLPWGPAFVFPTRHVGPTPEEALEQLPSFIPVAGGDVIRVLNPAQGGINFFNGLGPPFFGPNGNGLGGSNLGGLGGISGYKGPQGPLTGVFLDNTVPSAGPAPPTLDFTPTPIGLGTDFLSLSPALRQVFYIGDGVTSGNVFQTFIAPAGATRLFFGIPDGFNFINEPGAYDDNDGAYSVRVGVNEIPTLGEVPEPASLVLWGLGACVAFFARRRQRRAA